MNDLLSSAHRSSRLRRLCQSLALAALLVGLTPQLARAQLGVGLAYGTDTEIGAQVSYYRSIAISEDIEGVSVGGDLTLYLPQDFGNEFADVTLTFLEINANGHYTVVEGEANSFYALGGLNYAYASYSSDADDDFGFGGYSASGGDVGLNVGGGGELPVGFGLAFAEAKFTLGGFRQLGLLVGLRFGGD